MNGGIVMKKAQVRAVSTVTQVSGGREIERFLHDEQLIQKVVRKALLVMDAMDCAALGGGDRDAVEMAKVASSWARIGVDVYKFVAAMQVKTASATDEVDLLDVVKRGTDEQLRQIVEKAQTLAGGEDILEADAEVVVEEGEDDGDAA